MLLHIAAIRRYSCWTMKGHRSRRRVRRRAWARLEAAVRTRRLPVLLRASGVRGSRLRWRCFSAASRSFASHVSHLSTPDEPADGRRHHRADRRPGAARRRARPAEIRQGQAAADQRRPSVAEPQRRCRRRPAATRRCSPAASTSTTPRSTRSAMPRRAPNGCASHAYEQRDPGHQQLPHAAQPAGDGPAARHGAELEPYPVVNTQLDDGGWMTKPRRAARAVHRIQQISGCAGARRAAASAGR